MEDVTRLSVDCGRRCDPCLTFHVDGLCLIPRNTHKKYILGRYCNEPVHGTADVSWKWWRGAGSPGCETCRARALAVARTLCIRRGGHGVSSNLVAGLSTHIRCRSEFASAARSISTTSTDSVDRYQPFSRTSMQTSHHHHQVLTVPCLSSRQRWRGTAVSGGPSATEGPNDDSHRRPNRCHADRG